MKGCYRSIFSSIVEIVLSIGGVVSAGCDTVEITETVCEISLATYTKPLVGLTAIPLRSSLRGIVATTVLVDGSITYKVPPNWIAP
jgi:hypothetical protein